jgi:hypothetical protein
MQGWQTPYLGQREIPRELSQFELQAFFSFSAVEHELIARRRGDSLKLGFALHIGFVRMSGRPLNNVRAVPTVLLAHLGRELSITAPDLASVRALYARGRTLFDHQQQACECLGFRWMTEHQRRALVRVLRDDVAQCADRQRLLTHARQWLYDHKLPMLRNRDICALAAAALIDLERETAASIRATVPASTLRRWTSALNASRPDGQPCQSWLWSTPAKHSTRQITEVLERIAYLTELGIDRSLGEINNVLVRRYARRLAARSPSVNARIKEPARTVELACFLRYSLLTATDQLILMFQRRVADLWRHCADGVTASVDWAQQYQQLLQELTDIATKEGVADAELRARGGRFVPCWWPSASCLGRPAASTRYWMPWASCKRSTGPAPRACLPMSLHRAWVRPGVRSSPMPTGSEPSERWRWPPCLPCVALCATVRSGSNTP